MQKIFVDSVLKACDEALKLKSFETPRNGTRFIRLDENFLGWVGLNKGNYADNLQINPFIGIHCIPIMRLNSHLAAEKYKQGVSASYAIHMGEIAPKLRQFIFSSSTDLHDEAERLANEIATHALPWMKAHASYEILIPLFESKLEMLGGYPERYVSALYYSGKIEKAKNFVQERTDIFDPNDKGVYSLYEKFGKPFLDMLEGEKDRNSCGA
ncbi:MAG: hypothetical protein ABJN69_14895 [Hellea sp.]